MAHFFIGKALQVNTVEDHPSGSGFIQSQDQPANGGLAGTALSCQAKHLAAANGKAYPVDCFYRREFARD